VSSLKILSSRISQYPNASLVLYNSPHTPEIAALISYTPSSLQKANPRQLTIIPRSGKPVGIPVVSPLWEPLAYPLLFPHGSPGWGVSCSDQSLDGSYAESVPTTQMWYYRARLLREKRFRIFGRLTNEYIIDMFSRDLESRLYYIRENQSTIRYIDDDLRYMNQDGLNMKESVYLPSSFVGSKCWSADHGRCFNGCCRVWMPIIFCYSNMQS